HPSESHNVPASSTPVEMSNLQSHTDAQLSTIPASQDTASTSIPPQAHVSPAQASHLSNEPTFTTPPQTADGTSTSSRPQPYPAPLTRAETEAIGPSSDNPTVIPNPAGGPAVIITLLLTSSARHPYKIDEKYLKKRGVKADIDEAGVVDPFSISVYTLKELIWRDWRDEWEQRPTSPSSIRLIHFGKMLDDKSQLRGVFNPRMNGYRGSGLAVERPLTHFSECRFQAESANVVHMTIKPQEVVDDEDAKIGKGISRDRDNERTPGCR
ncbi:hypothetical protein LTR16_005577, partial [Cryomyces antarcticus]